MKTLLWSSIICSVVLVLTGCEFDRLTAVLELPECQTPVPIFSTDPASTPGSAVLGCPYGYITATGDTVFVPGVLGAVP